MRVRLSAIRGLSAIAVEGDIGRYGVSRGGEVDARAKRLE